MAKAAPPKPSPLEAGILSALRSIDNQVARNMLRTPAEREVSGVQKWEPYDQKIELITSLVLENLANRAIELDGVLVLAQAMCKALQMYCDELGQEGLGKMRSEYCSVAFEAIQRNASSGLSISKVSEIN